MQYRIAPPVICPWMYGGVFIAIGGTITTWEWVLPDPNSEYPYEFRFVYDVDGSASNVVTIDPLNPPPIGDGNGNGATTLPWNLILFIGGLIIVGGIIYFTQKKR